MTEQHANRAVIASAGLMFLVQVILTFYRANIQSVSPAGGLALAPVFLLPLLAIKSEVRLLRVSSLTVGSILLVTGLAIGWLALLNPVASLVRRLSLPLFLVALGTLMLTPMSRARVRAGLIAIVLVAATGIELTATIEAHHVRKAREQGILAHWH